jgi:hypothetical protein
MRSCSNVSLTRSQKSFRCTRKASAGIMTISRVAEPHPEISGEQRQTGGDVGSSACGTDE